MGYHVIQIPVEVAEEHEHLLQWLFNDEGEFLRWLVDGKLVKEIKICEWDWGEG